jgi:hypothetical protein
MRLALAASIPLIAALLAPVDAHALIFRAYLASDGNDANPCTLQLPCRLLPAAHAAVADGGEIWMLDSANYNTSTVSIGKSVTILAVPGAVGSVLAIAGPAISMSTPSIAVTLRNLVIGSLPGGGGTDGVAITTSNASLIVENSVFASLPQYGINATGLNTVAISDTVIRNTAYAIVISNGIRATIANTRMMNNAGGVIATGTTSSTTRANVSDSVISGGDNGVYSSTSIAGASVAIVVTRSTIAYTTYPLGAETAGGGAAEVIIASSLVHDVGYRWYQSGANSAVASYGNNQFLEYSTSFGSLTTITQQ